VVLGDGGDVSVVADVTCSSGVHIHCDVSATGNAYLTNSCTIDEDLWAGGNIVLDSNARATGSASATGSVRFVNTARVAGDVHAGTTVTSAEGRTIAALQAAGIIGGQVVTGTPVTPPVVHTAQFAYDPADWAGSTVTTWPAWMNATATANAAPSWSQGLSTAPDSIQAISGLRAVSADGSRHALRLLVPGVAASCANGHDISVPNGADVDPLVSVQLFTPGTVNINGPATLMGRITAGCVAASGTVRLTAATVTTPGMS
jgi:hypothetical protein